MSHSPGVDPNVPPTQAIPPAPESRPRDDDATQVIAAAQPGTTQVLPAGGDVQLDGPTPGPDAGTSATQVLAAEEGTTQVLAVDPRTTHALPAHGSTHVLPAHGSTQVLAADAQVTRVLAAGAATRVVDLGTVSAPPPAGGAETRVTGAEGWDATQVVPAHQVDSWLPPASTQVIATGLPDPTQVLAAEVPAAAPVRRSSVFPATPAPGGPYRSGTGAVASPATRAASTPYRTPPAHEPYPAGRRPVPSSPFPSGAGAQHQPVAPTAATPVRSPQGYASSPTPGGHAPTGPAAQVSAHPAPQATATPYQPAPRGAVRPHPPAARPGADELPRASRPQAAPVERRREPDRAPVRVGTEPTAVAAIIAAVVGFVVPLVGILAIVLGGIGADRARRRGTGGRGMARTATVLGSIQVIVTTLVVVGGLLLWNAVADDLRRGLDQLDGVALPELSLPDLALGGLTGDLTVDDVTEILGTVGQVGELGDLADLCGSGDVGACDDLVGQIPDGLLPSS